MNQNLNSIVNYLRINHNGKTSFSIPINDILNLMESKSLTDNKTAFIFHLKNDFNSLGIDYNVIGDNVRFKIKKSFFLDKINPIDMIPTPNEIKKTSKVIENNEKLINFENDNFVKYLEKADENPNSGTNFKHKYVIPEIYQYFKFSMEDPYCFPLVVGPPSSGKSRMAEEVCKSMDRHNELGEVIGKGVPCIRINAEEISEPEELVGGLQLITNPKTNHSETIFVPGILVEAWIKGWVLIVDEIDRASIVARKQFNSITEIGSRLMVKTHQGFKFFNKHPDACFVFTANTWGNGDFEGLYSGAEVLNKAWLSRIGPKFELDIDLMTFRIVLEEYNPETVIINLLFNSSAGLLPSIHSTIKNNNLPETISLRSLIRFIKCYPKFGWHVGLETCFINDFQECNRDTIRRIFNAILGEGASPCMKLTQAENNFLKKYKIH